MGVEHITVIGYGLVITYEEGIRLIKELDLLEEGETHTDEELLNLVEDFFNRGPICGHSDAYSENSLNKELIILDSNSQSEVSVYEILKLDIKPVPKNNLLTGISERLDKDLTWLVYSYMW